MNEQTNESWVIYQHMCVLLHTDTHTHYIIYKMQIFLVVKKQVKTHVVETGGEGGWQKIFYLTLLSFANSMLGWWQINET